MLGRRSSRLALFSSGLGLLVLFRSLSNLENTAQACIFDTWLEKTRFGVTSKPLGSRRLGSGSLRGHLARENSARSHFEVEETRENSARSHFEVEKTRRNLARSHFDAEKTRENSARSRYEAEKT